VDDALALVPSVDDEDSELLPVRRSLKDTGDGDEDGDDIR